MAASPARSPRLDRETHAAFRIIALANRVSASASRAYLRCYGVGVMEWRVLALLAVEDGATAHDLSVTSGVDKSAVSRAVNALIRQRFVTSKADTRDNRRSLLSLTAKGLALHDRIIKASLAREARLLAGFTAADKARLFELIGRLEANLPSVEAHDPAADG